MDGVKASLGCRGIMGEVARHCVKDRKEWPFHFFLAQRSFEPPSRALFFITSRRLGCRYMMRLLGIWPKGCVLDDCVVVI